MPRMLSHTLERVLSLCVCKVGAFDRERLLALAAIVEAAPLTRLALVKVFLSHPILTPPPVPPPLVKAFCLTPGVPHICHAFHSRLISADVFFN